MDLHYRHFDYLGAALNGIVLVRLNVDSVPGFLLLRLRLLLLFLYLLQPGLLLPLLPLLLGFELQFQPCPGLWVLLRPMHHHAFHGGEGLITEQTIGGARALHLPVEHIPELRCYKLVS